MDGDVKVRGEAGTGSDQAPVRNVMQGLMMILRVKTKI